MNIGKSENMFRRQPAIINVHQPTRTEYVTRTVVEKRAPTDESVRLLAEMEQAARDRIVQSIRVNTNEVSCQILVFNEPHSTDFIARAVLDINGQRVTADVRLNPDDQSNFMKTLRDAVASEIATKVLTDAFSKMDRITLFKAAKAKP
jgi:hypothetical protein